MLRQFRNSRLWIRLLAALLLPLLLLPGYSGAQDMLRLTLQNAAPGGSLRSSGAALAQQLRVISGGTVTMQRGEGRDYQLQGGGLFWTQVQEVPQNADSLSLTPTLRGDGSIEVDVAVARKLGSRRENFRSTLRAQPGEWLQLYGPAEAASQGGKRYSTRSVSQESLYLLVEPAR